MPLQAEERLFIEAMRDLNQQASRMQEEEKKESVEPTQSHPTASLPSNESRSSDEDDSKHGINQLSSGTTKHQHYHNHLQPSAVAANVWDKNSNINMSAAALVHAATNTLVDAASRLNNNNNKLSKDASSSPSLDSITSWTKIPSKTVDTGGGGLSTIEGIMGNKKRPYVSAGFK